MSANTGKIGPEVLNNNPAAHRTVELMQGGDVILLLRDDSKLLVSTVILRLASKVFRAMFGSRFMEGQDLNTSVTKTVSLPDDPPDALRLLLSILHHRYDLVRRPDLYTLKDMTILADKYDCVAAIAPIGWAWGLHFVEAKEMTNYKSYETLVIVAYIVNNSSLFRIASTNLVLHVPGSFAELADLADFVPGRMMSMF